MLRFLAFSEVLSHYQHYCSHPDNSDPVTRQPLSPFVDTGGMSGGDTGEVRIRMCKACLTAKGATLLRLGWPHRMMAFPCGLGPSLLQDTLSEWRKVGVLE